ncbi:MAG TPA: hypothetical protein VEK08_09000, partial [Planctomycetota bacterium]|nr:hypothetical protein [Planctomycetota bacterium]
MNSHVSTRSRCAGVLLAAAFFISNQLFAADILYVAHLSLNTQDTYVVNRLRSQGHTVTVVADDKATVAHASGKAMVVLSMSVDLGKNLGTTFKNVTIPVVTWNDELQTQLGWTGPTKNAHYGRSDKITSIIIEDPTHPLAAGFAAGDLTILTDDDEHLGWGIPNSSAQVTVVAILPVNARKAIYEYKPGATLHDGSIAAARRIFFFLGDTAPDQMNENFVRLMDAVFDYAAYGNLSI